MENQPNKFIFAPVLSPVPDWHEGQHISIDNKGYKIVSFDFAETEQKVMANILTPDIQYWTDNKGLKHIIPQDLWGFPKNRPYSSLINPDTLPKVRKCAAIAAYFCQAQYNAKIKAIKYVRQEMGWGLYESKTFVDDVCTGEIYVSFGQMMAFKQKAMEYIHANPGFFPPLPEYTSTPGPSKHIIPHAGSLHHLIVKLDTANSFKAKKTPWEEMTLEERRAFRYPVEAARYIQNCALMEMNKTAGWIESARDLLDFAHRRGYTKLQPEQAADIWKDIQKALGGAE